MRNTPSKFYEKNTLKKWIQYLQFLSQKEWNNYKPRIRGKLFKASFFIPACPILCDFSFEAIKSRQGTGVLEQRSWRRCSSSHWANIEIRTYQTCLMSWHHIIHWGIFNQANKMSLACFFSSRISTDQQPCLTSRSPHSETDTVWENICSSVLIPTQHAESNAGQISTFFQKSSFQICATVAVGTNFLSSEDKYLPVWWVSFVQNGVGRCVINVLGFPSSFNSSWVQVNMSGSACDLCIFTSLSPKTPHLDDGNQVLKFTSKSTWHWCWHWQTPLHLSSALRKRLKDWWTLTSPSLVGQTLPCNQPRLFSCFTTRG